MNTSIWNILSNNLTNASISKGIEIPMIQRDYAQGRKNAKSLEIREQFLHNIKKHLESFNNGIIDKLELDFVYGYVERECFVPLDGQQRLTTLFLLHWYCILKNNLLENYSEQLNRFKYQTRESTAQFVSNLISKYDFEDYTESKTKHLCLSESIKGKNWYFGKWKYDGTIQSMLIMIDAIDNVFCDFDFPLYLLLDENNFVISFNFLNIEKLGLSDDLYVKMNARGKSLTNFENLKAELSKLIEESGFNNTYQFDVAHTEGIKKLNVENYFITKIDTTWTDYFWNLRDKKTNDFDDKLLNVLSFIALNQYAKLINNQFDQIRENFQKKIYLPSFYQFKNLGFLTEEVIIDYINFLDVLVSTDSCIKSYMANDRYFSKNELLTNIVFESSFKPLYVDRLRFYGITKFIELTKDNPKRELELQKFDRLIHNLTVTSNTFNKSEDFIKSLEGLDAIFKNYQSDIHETFLHVTISGFDSVQVQEEKLKIALIERGNQWMVLIHEIESQKYLNGQINFLLTFSGLQDSYDFNQNVFLSDNIESFLPNLEELYQKYLLYFDDGGVINFKNQDFRVALLSIGFYLIHSKNWCFVMNNDRDASWKRYFREVFNRSKQFENSISFLKILFDETDTSLSAKDNLKRIKELNPVSKDDWRSHFVKNPRFIGHRNNYYIRLWDDGYDIHMLNGTIFSNRAIELFTYIVHEKLQEKGISSKIEFIDKYDRSGIVSIGSKKSKLVFGAYYNRKFILLQRGIEDIEFQSVTSVVNYIAENYSNKQ